MISTGLRQNTAFISLAGGNFVSLVGSQGFFVASTYWVAATFDSASLAGMFMLLSMIPAVLVGPFAGVYVDRNCKRQVIVRAQLICFSISLLASAFFFLSASNAGLLLYVIFVANFLLSLVKSFSNPAYLSVVPDIVDEADLLEANGLMRTAGKLSDMIGKAAGGVVYKTLGPAFLFFADSISYLISAYYARVLPRKIPAQGSAGNDSRSLVGGYLSGIKEGLSYIHRYRGMKHFFVFALVINILSTPIFVLLPFHVEKYLDGGPEWYGFIYGALGAGAVIGHYLTSRLQRTGIRQDKALVLSVVSMCFSFLLFSLAEVKILSLAFMLIAGIFNGIFSVHVVTLIQRSTTPVNRGTVFSTFGALSGAILPFAYAISGLLGDLADKNTGMIFIIASILMTLVAVLMSLTSSFRSFLSSSAENPGPS